LGIDLLTYALSPVLGNIFLSLERTIKVGDLGLSKKFSPGGVQLE